MRPLLIILTILVFCPIVPAQTILGTVVDSDGKPVEAADVYASLEREITGRTKTDAQGRFTLDRVGDKPVQYVFARKPGLAINYVFTDETPGIREKSEFGPKGDPSARKIATEPLQLVLDRARTVKFRIIDFDGNPLAGIRVCPWPETHDNRYIDLVYSFHRDGRKEPFLWPHDPEFVQISDSDGWVVFDWFPDWQTEHVQFHTEDPDPEHPRYLPREMHYRPRTLRPEVVDAVYVALERAVEISGTIRLPDGTPVPSCKVDTLARSRISSPTTTDADGGFRFHLPPNLPFTVSLSPKPVDGKFWTLPKSLELNSGENGLQNLQWTLEKAGRFSGQITGGPDKQPLTQEFQYCWILNKERTQLWTERVDSQGRYAGILPPGQYEMDLDYNLHRIRTNFELREGEDLTVDVHEENAQPETYRTVLLHVVLDEDGEFPVPLANLWFDSRHQFQLASEIARTADQTGTYTLTALNRPIAVKAMSPDRKFGTFLILEPDQTEINLVLEPVATLQAKLVDQQDRPVKNCPIQFSITAVQDMPSYAFPAWFSETQKTAQNGEVSIPLLPGREYNFYYGMFSRYDPRKDKASMSRRFLQWKPQAGETKEVQERITPLYSMKDEYWNSFGRWGDISGIVESPLEQRFPTFLAAAKTDDMTPLVLFVDSSSPKLKQNMVALFEKLETDPDLSERFDNCIFFTVQTDTTPWDNGTVHRNEAKSFAIKRGIDENRLEQPLLCIFNVDGTCEKTETLDALTRPAIDPETKEETVDLDREALLRFFGN